MSSIQLSISFAVTCMNRLSQVKETILSNLIALNRAASDLEIVLLDYGSTDGLYEWAKCQPQITDAIAEGRLKYVQVAANSWHMSKARNLAHRFCRGEYLFNLDCDNFVTEQNIELFRRQWRLDPSSVIWQHAGNRTDGTCGRIGMRRIDFLALGGYDEQLPPVAGQDIDLLERAKIRGHHVHRHIGGSAIASSIEQKMAYLNSRAPKYSDMLALSTKMINERKEKQIWRANEQGWGAANHVSFDFDECNTHDFGPLFPEDMTERGSLRDGTVSEFERRLAQNLCRHQWIYSRVGYDQRPIGFALDGFITKGAAHYERRWRFSRHADAVSTETGYGLELIDGSGEVTCLLRSEAPDDLWNGKWEVHEKMPIEIIRQKPESVAAPSTQTSDKLDDTNKDIGVRSRAIYSSASNVAGLIHRINGLRGNHPYNAGILAVDGGADPEYLLCYRPQLGDEYALAWAILDRDFICDKSRNVVMKITRNDDPRLIALPHGPALIAISSDSDYFRTAHVVMWELPRGKLPTSASDCNRAGKFLHVHDWPGYVKNGAEKNWVPFVREEVNECCFVYSIGPVHRVMGYRPATQTVHMQHHVQWALPDWWDRNKWGTELRGCAPPSRLDGDRFFSTWHTKVKGSYYTGFYTFSARPPLGPLEMSPPVLLPEHSEGGKYTLRGKDMAVIFIGGLVLEKERVILSGGDADDKAILVTFSLQEIMNALQPVEVSSPASSGVAI